MDESALFWGLALLTTIIIALELRTGTIRIYRAPKEWRLVEKEKDEGRFWLLVGAEVLLVIILIGQALSA